VTTIDLRNPPILDQAAWSAVFTGLLDESLAAAEEARRGDIGFRVGRGKPPARGSVRESGRQFRGRFAAIG